MLSTGKIQFNEGDYHVFVINAHKGKNSEHGGVLKHAIRSMLLKEKYEEETDFHADMEEGTFLVLLFGQG
jgi:hypothetical protein